MRDSDDDDYVEEDEDGGRFTNSVSSPPIQRLLKGSFRKEVMLTLPKWRGRSR